MKTTLILSAFLAFVLVLSRSGTQAYPQRVYVQKLPYYPPPTRPPPILRAKREVTLKDTVKTNPNGGQDVSLKATKSIGDDKIRGFGSVSAAGNTNGGGIVKEASVGVAGLNRKGQPSKSLILSVENSQDSIRDSLKKQAEANLRLGERNSLTGTVSQTDTKINGFDLKSKESSTSFKWKNDLGFGAGISRDVQHGVGSELTKSLSANIMDRNDHSLDATLFHSKVRQTNGFNFDKTGGILDYSHANGHSLSAGLTRFSGIGDQASLSGRSTLFTSNDGLTKLNANVGANKWLNGPYTSQRDFNFGLGLSYNGWRG
ncbi:sarcotoxin-2A-like [Cochliomyia hominivorax]